eukprot:CAMPEP_0173171110 /NCGR_PEP_ID=MMETSP1141-20130122/1588_1 /TAXON_ID=483371 /ORGANISM="non described non described, Strain CCMP2298" /LENGTH=533 /DNA_ID=CAMNT_0014093033 /DNA_START=111 /DNA_END=1709 /DNA_ORIENTATION=-
MPARLLTVVVFLVLVFGLNVAFRPLLKGTLGTSFRQQLKKQLFSVQVNKDDWRGISYSELKSDRSTFLDVVKKRAQTASPLRRSEESEVHKLLQVHSASLEASGLSRLTYNLGTLVTSGAGNSGAGSGRGSRDSASVLLGCVPRVAGQMGAGDVSSLLVGLARMGVKWRDIQRVGVLMDRVEVLIGKADETEIADIMWSLGTMGARWSEVRWKEALLNSLVLRIRKFSAYTLSSSLWSLAKVGVRWQDFDAAQKFQIMDQIAKVSTKVSPQNASKLLWALGSFGANFRHFPLGLLETLVLRVGDTKKSKMGNALSASHALSGTAKTGLQWTQASGATRAGLWEQVERVCQTPVVDRPFRELSKIIESFWGALENHRDDGSGAAPSIIEMIRVSPSKARVDLSELGNVAKQARLLCDFECLAMEQLPPVVGDVDSDEEVQQGATGRPVALAQRQRLLLRYRGFNGLGDEAPLQPQHLTNPVMAAFTRWYCWGFGLQTRASSTRGKVRITLGTLAVEHARLQLPFLDDQALYPLL